MQLLDAVGDDHALGVLPWAAADAVARIDAAGARGAQVSVPGAAAGTGRCGERLALPVGARQAAEVRTLAGAAAGDEEAKFGLLPHAHAGASGDQRGQRGARNEAEAAGSCR